MSDNKKDNKDIDPSEERLSTPTPESPPETPRDELTGSYVGKKQDLAREWFAAAKRSSNKNMLNRSIDPKQVVYNAPVRKKGKK